MSDFIPISEVRGSSGNLNGMTGASGESGFSQFLSGASSAVGDLAAGGLSIAGGGLGMSTDLFGLIEMQRQLQMEMETVSMISNIDKSRHESKMAAIRNIRTS